MSDVQPGLDLLAVGAHADDVELGCGGTLVKVAQSGFSTGILDITNAALSTRGDVVTRRCEAEAAASVLGATRIQLGAEESRIYPDSRNLENLVEVIRTYRPKLMLVHYWEDRHPDHVAVSRLTESAVFWAGIAKFGNRSLPPHRPRRLMFYYAHYEFSPSIIVDISDTFETKMRSVREYKSQFFNKEVDEPETFISRPEFMERVTTRARYWGDRIGVKYGEPFSVRQAIRVNDVMNWTLEQGDLG